MKDLRDLNTLIKQINMYYLTDSYPFTIEGQQYKFHINEKEYKVDFPKFKTITIEVDHLTLMKNSVSLIIEKIEQAKRLMFKEFNVETNWLGTIKLDGAYHSFTGANINISLIARMHPIDKYFHDDAFNGKLEDLIK